MSAAADIAGLAALLGAGALVASGAYVAGLWRDVTNPPRRGMGWALGQGFASSPSDLGLEFEERSIRSPGATVPCWWIRGQGDAREVVVLVHGHGRSRWDSLRRAGPWVDRAALLVLPDLRGHGEAAGRGTLARREPADLCAVIAEAERSFPGARVTLAGHSLGAVAAIHAAALRAEAGSPVEAVVAWGPYDRVRTPFEERLRLRGLPVRPFSDAVLWLLDRLDGPERPTREAAAALRDTRLEVHADELDPVSPVGDARAIAQACPRATLHVSRGVAHADIGT